MVFKKELWLYILLVLVFSSFAYADSCYVVFTTNAQSTISYYETNAALPTNIFAKSVTISNDGSLSEIAITENEYIQGIISAALPFDEPYEVILICAEPGNILSKSCSWSEPCTATDEISGGVTTCNTYDEYNPTVCVSSTTSPIVQKTYYSLYDFTTVSLSFNDNQPACQTLLNGDSNTPLPKVWNSLSTPNSCCGDSGVDDVGVFSTSGGRRFMCNFPELGKTDSSQIFWVDAQSEPYKLFDVNPGLFSNNIFTPTFITDITYSIRIPDLDISTEITFTPGNVNYMRNDLGGSNVKFNYTYIDADGNTWMAFIDNLNSDSSISGVVNYNNRNYDFIGIPSTPADVKKVLTNSFKAASDGIGWYICHYDAVNGVATWLAPEGTTTTGTLVSSTDVADEDSGMTTFVGASTTTTTTTTTSTPASTVNGNDFISIIDFSTYDPIWYGASVDLSADICRNAEINLDIDQVFVTTPQVMVLISGSGMPLFDVVEVAIGSQNFPLTGSNVDGAGVFGEQDLAYTPDSVGTKDVILTLSDGSDCVFENVFTVLPDYSDVTLVDEKLRYVCFDYGVNGQVNALECAGMNFEMAENELDAPNPSGSVADWSSQVNSRVRRVGESTQVLQDFYGESGSTNYVYLGMIDNNLVNPVAKMTLPRTVAGPGEEYVYGDSGIVLPITDWSEYDYLEFDIILTHDAKVDIEFYRDDSAWYEPFEISTDAYTSVALFEDLFSEPAGVAFFDSHKAPQRWHHVRIDLSTFSDVTDIDFFRIFVDKTSIDSTLKIDNVMGVPVNNVLAVIGLDNFYLNSETDKYDAQFCAGAGMWVESLDDDMYACNNVVSASFSSFNGDGQCCGNEVYGESFEDEPIGCWNGIAVGDAQLVDLPLVNDAGDNVSVLYSAGDFVSCGKDMINLQLSDSTLAVSDICQVEGTYFCANNSDDSKWIRRNDPTFGGASDSFVLSTAIWNQTTEDYRSECCSNNKCWNGTRCVDELTIFELNETDALVCFQSSWAQPIKKDNWLKEYDQYGWCLNDSQCWVDDELPNMNLLNLYFDVDGLDCTNASKGYQYYDDYICAGQGEKVFDWTTRTKLVALELYNITVQNNIDSFNIFCEEGEKIFNNLDYYYEGSIADTLGVILTNDNFNNFCVLQVFDSDMKTEKVVLGTSFNDGMSMNQKSGNGLIGGFFQNFAFKGLYLANNDENSTSFEFCDVSATNNLDGRYHDCLGISGGDAQDIFFYNALTNSVIYAPDTLNFGAGGVFDWFADLFRSIFDIFGARHETDDDVVDFLTHGPYLYNKIYIAKSADGGKMVTAVYEETKNALMIEYTNIDDDICGIIGKYAKSVDYPARLMDKMTCEDDGSKITITSSHRLAIETIWLELTAKLRLT